MASVIVKLRARLESIVRWMEQSYLFWISLIILAVWIASSMVYAWAEDPNGITIKEIINVAFYILVLIFGEVSIDPQTIPGRVTAIIILIMGILLFAVAIGEMSNRLIQRFLNRDKIKLKRFYSGSDHVVVCGLTPKVNGLLGELRSKDLERSSHAPVVIVSDQVGELRIGEKWLRKRVYGIQGDPLDPNALRRAGVDRAKSIVIFTKEGDYKGKRVYQDSYAAMVYKSIYNFLTQKQVARHIRHDINVVLEFLDESINLLPCCRDQSDRPEVYLDPIGDTGNCLIVEPIFMEKLSTFLLVQAVLQKEIDDVIQRLLTTQITGTNEFYYIPVDDATAGKTFYALEKAMLKTNAIPIGVLRNYGGLKRKAGPSGGVCAGGGNVELLINPNEEVILAKGDLIVTISYNEREAKQAQEMLGKAQWEVKPKKASVAKNVKSSFRLPFERLYILNWDRNQVRDTLLELAKVYKNHMDHTTGRTLERMPITIVTKHVVQRIQGDYDDIKEYVDKNLGSDMNKYLDVKLELAKAPLALKDLTRLGITPERDRDIRMLILAEEYDEQDPDLMTLYQSQLIENRVSRDIFTAVELNEFTNIHLFGHSFVDVIVSVDDFCEKLMAQAVLKPYLSLIFRNLLTFSEDTNEFYIRRVDKKWHGKTIMEFQEALIGLPVIFVGHVRPRKRKAAKNGVRARGASQDAVISVNPRWEGDYDERSIGYKRVKKGDRLQPGDEVILIAREPRIVDQVLAGV